MLYGKCSATTTIKYAEKQIYKQNGEIYVIYNEIIDNFIENLDNGQNTLYFFKGFTVDFYTYLLGKKQFPRFVEREIFDVFKEVADTK